MAVWPWRWVPHITCFVARTNAAPSLVACTTNITNGSTEQQQQRNNIYKTANLFISSLACLHVQVRVGQSEWRLWCCSLTVVHILTDRILMWLCSVLDFVKLKTQLFFFFFGGDNVWSIFRAADSLHTHTHTHTLTHTFVVLVHIVVFVQHLQRFEPHIYVPDRGGIQRIRNVIIN